jgi:antitoxin component of MazEF toxin-antitoxin module
MPVTTRRTLRRAGGTLEISIPRIITESLKWGEGDIMTISVENEHLRIYKEKEISRTGVVDRRIIRRRIIERDKDKG